MSSKKSRRFRRKIVLPGFWGTWLYQSTLFDLANTVLASNGPVETICLNSVGYGTHRAVTGPMSFKKSRRFVGKPCSRDFEAPGCHPSTLIDILHTAWAIKFSVKTICLISEGYRTHRGVTGPMSFKKSRRFCRKIVLPGFWGTWLYQSTLFDLANTVLASKSSVETICLNSVGYGTNRAVTGPMSFQKSRRFVGKPCSRGFGAPGCHPSTLIDIVHTALASKCPVKTICLSSEGYRTHRSVTGPMSFKKSRSFCRKIVLPGFWGTWPYQSTLFDLANTVVASKGPVETICLISVGYGTHRAVSGPMSFKKLRRFVGKPCSRDFEAPGCHPSTLIDIVHSALASKCSVKTIRLVSEGYRTHRAVTGPMSFKKTRRFVGKSCSRVFGAPGYIIALYLTLQTLFWLVRVL